MKTIDNDSESSLSGYYCVLDIKEKNAENKPKFPADMIRRAELLHSAVSQAYPNSTVYKINYRQTMIAVKVGDIYNGDRLSKQVDQLNTMCANDDTTEVVKTTSGMIYRLLA